MSSILDKYMGGPGPEDRSEDLNALDSPAAMLDLVLANGDHMALPYATLLRVKQMGGRIELTYSTDTVVIEGHALDELHKAIIQHRARRIEVGDPRQLAAATGSSSVSAITVTAVD